MDQDRRIASLSRKLQLLEYPAELSQRPEYRKRPDQPWISGALAELRSLRQLAGAHPAEAERDLLRRFAWAAQANEDWLRDQLLRELAALVRYYSSGNWAEAIREDLPGETWYVLHLRDQIEAILRAPELLAVQLRFPSDLLHRIEQADALFRTVEEVRIEYADPEERATCHARQDWWWWLDQPAV